MALSFSWSGSFSSSVMSPRCWLHRRLDGPNWKGFGWADDIFVLGGNRTVVLRLSKSIRWLIYSNPGSLYYKKGVYWNVGVTKLCKTSPSRNWEHPILPRTNIRRTQKEGSKICSAATIWYSMDTAGWGSSSVFAMFISCSSCRVGQWNGKISKH